MKTIIQFALFLASFLAVNAQSSIKGLIADQELQPIPAAIVSVYNTDKSTFIKANVAGDDGTFLIKNLIFIQGLLH